MRRSAFAPLAVYTRFFKFSLFSIVLTKPIDSRTRSALVRSTSSYRTHHQFQSRIPLPFQPIRFPLVPLQTTLIPSFFQPLCGRTTGPVSHTMDRQPEGSRVQLACLRCIESNSPCNGQLPCDCCRHYSLNCVYPSRRRPACLECSRSISECDGETPCQRCRQRGLRCVPSTQVEPGVVTSQSEEAWPEQSSFGSRPGEMETRPTVARGSVGGGETRHDTREPDSYFIKEHNKGIDEDHLAKFKPDKKEWKMDRIA